MPQAQLDSIDLRILEELQANARLTNVDSHPACIYRPRPA